jgi:hypothetical protein
LRKFKEKYKKQRFFFLISLSKLAAKLLAIVRKPADKTPEHALVEIGVKKKDRKVRKEGGEEEGRGGRGGEERKRERKRERRGRGRGEEEGRKRGGRGEEGERRGRREQGGRKGREGEEEG